VVVGAAVLCALGWAASLFPLVAGTAAGGAVLVAGLVAFRRHVAVRVRIERDIREQSTAGRGPWADDGSGEEFDAPVLGVVDGEREAA
jgi:hypothetical protein